MNKNFSEFPSDFFHLFNEVVTYVERDMPRMMGLESVNFSNQAFIKQGWTDESLSKWEKRLVDQHPEKYSKKAQSESSGRDILVKSGDLRKSIHYRVEMRRTIVYSEAKIAGKDVITYAHVHNEGLRAGRGKGFTMTKRKFMGHSFVLDQIYARKIETRLNKIFNI